MRAVLAFLVSFVLAAPAPAAPVVLKLATLAPDGSTWHLILKEMAEKWRQASAGEVELKIFAGGVAGDEPDMVRKMRVGQYQAAALTVVGLSLVAPEPQALSVPQMLASWEELDRVREQLAPTYEARLGEKGFVVLNWGDAGWVRFFSTRPVRTPDDMRALKVFVWAGDSHTVDLWRDMGFQPVALAATDIVPSLKTGLVEVVPMTALTALSIQAFVVARHMTAIRWAPLVGATVVTAQAWGRVPESLRPRLLAIARESGERLKSEIRRLDEDAVAAMVKKGVTVHELDASAGAAWRELVERAWPRVRGTIVPAGAFDAVRAARDAGRSAGGGKAAGAAGR